MENSGIIQKNSEQIGKIQKNLEKFRKIRKKLEKIGKNRENAGNKTEKEWKFFLPGRLFETGHLLNFS